MNIALIKAGGIGSRMGAGIPKQFLLVEGKPIVVYTLEVFERHPGIDAIIVVCVDGWHDVLKSYIKKYNITKVASIVSGGETSLKSIKEGIRESMRLFSRDDTILIHDANRPLVEEEIISDVLAQCNLHGSAVAAIPCTDEVMQTDGHSMSSDMFLDRTTLYRIQTPDAYNLGEVSEVLESATEGQLTELGATNTLMISAGHKVYFAKGSEVNIRLTTQEDITLLKSLLYVRSVDSCAERA